LISQVINVFCSYKPDSRDALRSWRDNNKLTLKYSIRECGVGSSESAYSPIVAAFEHGNESAGFKGLCFMSHCFNFPRVTLTNILNTI